MLDLQPKKLIMIDILDILQKRTDEEHRLTQKQIADILEEHYSMKVDRKTVKRNLTELADFCERAELGYRVEHSEVPRGNNPEADPICTDWYLSREITDAELRLLIDSILFSKYIPYAQCKDLISKLKRLSNTHFSHKVKHIASLSEHSSGNRQLFYTIETLDNAIEKGRKVQFYYGVFGADKKLEKKCNCAGESILYTVNPYQMAVTNGRYYLIGNTDPHDNLSHFRIDRILDVKLLDQPVKPIRSVQGLENGLILSRYMQEHLYMFSGESEHVTFCVKKQNLDEILDYFETDSLHLKEQGDSFVISVFANLTAMKYWAIQFCQTVEILSPSKLREEVGNTLLTAANKYQ